MIDTHIHIVPDVDDGAENLAMSLEMIISAKEQGIDEIIATPHYYVPNFVNNYISENFNLLVEEVRKKDIDMRLHLGNEVHLNEETLEALKNNKVNTMAKSMYLLIELPDYHYYNFHKTMLFDLLVDGYNLIIAHVERCNAFHKNEETLVRLINQGIYGQLSASYLVNKKTRKKGLTWIKKGYVHIVASDAHNLTKRPNKLKEAYLIVESYLGSDCAETLFSDNPKKIIRNEKLEIPKIKIKRFVLVNKMLKNNKK